MILKLLCTCWTCLSGRCAKFPKNNKDAEAAYEESKQNSRIENGNANEEKQTMHKAEIISGAVYAVSSQSQSHSYSQYHLQSQIFVRSFRFPVSAVQQLSPKKSQLFVFGFLNLFPFLLHTTLTHTTCSSSSPSCPWHVWRESIKNSSCRGCCGLIMSNMCLSCSPTTLHP